MSPVGGTTSFALVMGAAGLAAVMWGIGGVVTEATSALTPYIRRVER
jgi:hypothetical protein